MLAGIRALACTDFLRGAVAFALALFALPALAQTVSPPVFGPVQPLTLEYGNYASLYVEVQGTQPITYQWFKNGSPIPGATSMGYSISPAYPSDNGTYSVQATNAGGTATSPGIVLTINPIWPPVISLHPKTTSAPVGGYFTLSAEASGYSPLSYQWYRDGIAIAGATGTTYATSVGDGQGRVPWYTVTVTNPGGSVTSDPAQVIPVPAAPPQNLTWRYGQTSTFTSGSSLYFWPSVYGTYPMTFQWAFNGQPIPGATDSTLQFYPVTAANAGTYSLTASNAGGTETTSIVARMNYAGTQWMDARRAGDVVYFLYSAPARISRYDLSTEAWLPDVSLTAGKTPTAFWPSSSGMFIAYGADLVWRPLDLQSEQAVTTASAAITSMMGVGDLVFYFSYGMYSLPSRRVSDRSAGPYIYSFYPIDTTGIPTASESTRTLFYVDRNPSLYRFSFAADGTVAAQTSYHEFALHQGNRVYASPDGRRLFMGTGIIYDADTFGYVGAFGDPIDAMDFFGDGKPVVLRGRSLRMLDAQNYTELGRYTIPVAADAIFTRSSRLYAFRRGEAAAAAPLVSVVDQQALAPAALVAVPDPTNRRFSIDEAFVDGAGVLNILSGSLNGVLRWSPSTRSFLPSVQLRGQPVAASFTPAVDRLVLFYGDKVLTKVDLGAAAAEQPIASLPVDNPFRAMVAMDDLVFLNIEEYAASGDLRLIIDGSGGVRKLSGFYYWGKAIAWQSGTRQLYNRPDLQSYPNMVETFAVPANGVLNDSVPNFGQGLGSASGVVPPLRFNADGSKVVSANGKVLSGVLASLGQLSNTVIDAAWLGDGLYTIRALANGTQIQRWSLADYSLQDARSVPGMPLRVFRLGAGQLAVVGLADGYLVIHIINVPSGEVVTSYYNGPVVGAPPTVSTQPTPRTIDAGNSIQLSVGAMGAGSLTYQWRRNGVNLVDGGRISGATGSTLTISLTQGTDTGSYDVVVTNAAGSTTSLPVSVVVQTVPGSGVIKLAAGRYHSLRLDSIGRLFATGTNTYGQLGNGGTTNASAAQQLSLGGVSVADIAAGAQHSLFLATDRTLWATGLNDSGQLGDGSTTNRSSFTPVASEVVAVAAGNFHTAYLKSNGSLWTVGGNDSGQLGDGFLANRSSPLQVASGVVDVAAGIRQTLFLKSNGTLWGMGDLRNDGAISIAPSMLATNVRSMAAGGYHSLFVKHDDTLWAMGWNAFGQLGTGNTTDSTAPVQVATGVKSAACGYFFSLFLKNDGSLWAVGRNDFGQLGDGTTTNRSTPVLLANGVVTMRASESYVLFTRNDGSLWASGLNGNGQFGDGGTTSVSTPVQLTSGSLFVPPAVSPVSAAADVPNGLIHLSWAPALNATSYEVWRNATDNAGAATRIAQHVRWSVFEDISPLAGINYYWVRAINVSGAGPMAGPGAVGSLSALTPVAFTVQPADRTAVAGSMAVFSVTVSGSAPISYQWRMGGVNLADGGRISGATTNFLSISGVQPADAGSYDVVVANPLGSVTSNPATLGVNKLDQSIAFNLGGSFYFGQTLSLYASASSGLGVDFSVSGPARLSGSLLIATGVGEVTIAASQPGNSLYNPAPDAVRTIIFLPDYFYWSGLRFTPEEQMTWEMAGTGADPDGDGLPNLMEYALGLDPKAADTSGLPAMSATATDWVYTYTRPTDRPGLTYVVEVSTDLTTWTATGVAHELLSTSGGVDTWRAKYPLASASSVFFRLRATGQ